MENGIYECPICTEQKEPYSLLCGHTACITCLQKLKKQKQSCHKCRAPINSSYKFIKNFDLIEALEIIQQLKSPSIPPQEEIYWENLISNEQLLINIRKANWAYPTAVQQVVIPKILSNSSLLVESPNGSGKTGTFVLGSLLKICSDLRRLQIISISHTKEIKDLHFSIFSQMAENSEISVYKTQKHSTISGDCLPHVLCGTLESVSKFIARYCEGIDDVCVIVDECDEILSNDFGKNKLLSVLNRFSNKQVQLYSATLSEVSYNFNSENRFKCEIVSVQPPLKLSTKIKVFNFLPKDQSKSEFLIWSLRFLEFSMCIIFVNTRDSAVFLSRLMEKGYKVGFFSGQLEHTERELVLEQVRTARINVLVSTDLLGRGFDCRYTDLVINFECPMNPTNRYEPNYSGFFHRCGRTGRNNRYGTVINVLGSEDSAFFHKIFARYNISSKIESDLSGPIESIENNKNCYSGI